MPNLTAVYCTDHSAPDDVIDICRIGLLEADVPIISVSQKPIDFGTNICLGGIGRSYLSLIKQIVAGTEAAETDYVAVTEHDCLYPPDYFDFIPEELDVFYYNKNQYYFMWGEGGFGTCAKTKAKQYMLSQLICSKQALLEAMGERLIKAEKGYDFHFHPGSFEPGFNDGRKRCFRWSPTPVMDIQHEHNYCIERRNKTITV